MKNSFIEDIRLKLTTFSGEDGYILKKSSSSLRVHFALIGFFVMLIFIGCFVSATTFTYSLFDENPFISMPFGILWATIITIIYLLLLYTITPPTMPNKYKIKDKMIVTDENKHTRFFSASMIFRLGFMTLLAIIIAQPLNEFFFSSTVEPSLEKFKKLQKANMAIVADSLFIKDELNAKENFEKEISLKLNTKELNEIKTKLYDLNSKIDLDKDFLKKAFPLLDSINKYDNKSFFASLNTTQDSFLNELNILLQIEIDSDIAYQYQLNTFSIPNPKIADEFDKYQNQLKKIISAKIDNYNSLDILLSKSNFYTQKIKLLLAESFFAWIITFLVIFIFLLPIRLKFKVRNKRFYVLKRDIEERIVLEAYKDFRKKHSEVLENKIQEVNNEILNRLQFNISQLKEINKERYSFLLNEIKDELKPEKIDFYEKWENPPFRTIKITDKTRFSSEKEFLDLLYNTTE
jgi:hypothetical protein